MLCQKCGFGHMVDDSHHDIRVFKCWVCGERIYPGYPKRSGALVCSRCGSHMDETNELSVCMDCMKLLNIPTERLKGRNSLRLRRDIHEEKSIQSLHSKECRKRVTTAPPSASTL
jgi:hypothetical protein